jgi:hypothetical protein
VPFNCKDYVFSSLGKSWERTEDKQPEATAAVGAAIPLIGSCDAVECSNFASGPVPLV